MKLALLSWDEEGKYLYELIKKYNTVEYVIEIYPDRWCDLGDFKIISIGKAIDLYNKNRIDKFIIPCMRGINIYTGVFMPLLKRGVNTEDVLYAPLRVFKDKTITDEEKRNMICLFNERTDMDFLVLHITEHCNLSCAYCSMFAGLVREPKYMDYTLTEKYVKRLKNIFDQVLVFKLIGGEPFLNKEIGRYCNLIRSEYPLADIEIATNGTLILGQSEDIIDTLVKNNITLDITHYPVNNLIIDELNDFLNSRGIKHYLTQEVREFSKLYDLEGNSDVQEVFERCRIKFNCVNMKENKLAVCHVPFALQTASKEFDLNIAEAEYDFIDLCDETLDANKIRTLMNKPHGVCKFCHIDDYEEWKQLSTSQIGDISHWSI